MNVSSGGSPFPTGVCERAGGESESEGGPPELGFVVDGAAKGTVSAAAQELDPHSECGVGYHLAGPDGAFGDLLLMFAHDPSQHLGGDVIEEQRSRCPPVGAIEVIAEPVMDRVAQRHFKVCGQGCHARRKRDVPPIEIPSVMVRAGLVSVGLESRGGDGFFNPMVELHSRSL